jgi:hypothetical protein
MKKLNLIKAVFAVSLLSAVFIMDGCKKEATVKPAITGTATRATATYTGAVDSSNFLKGYLGNEAVKFEGHLISYNSYVDPDSITGRPNGNGNGQGEDDDAYYMSGSRWVSISQTGLQAVKASVELRSLAVRVFVSPAYMNSSMYYGLIERSTYQFSTDQNPGKGAYVSLYDKNGVLWTSAGDQDGSTLTVTSVGDNMNTYTVVSGIISCKMYDPQGNMKQLTGATFTASLGI